MNNLPKFKVLNSEGATQWTDEQQQAISLQGGRILVSAAAGSGKTAVLTERVIRLIKSGYDITRFLIVTFTVSAANEMRARIRNALQKELALNPENRHIHRQSLLVSRAKICTIDSFCGEIVRKNFQLAGVSPDFRVCSGADDELIKREALTLAFEEFYAKNDADFLNGVKIFSGTKNDEQYFNLIYGLIEWLYSLPYPQKSMELFCDMWSLQGENANMYESVFYKQIEEYIRTNIKGHINKYEYALNQMSKAEGFDKYIACCEAEVKMLNQVLSAKEPDEFCERLCLIAFKAVRAQNGADEGIRELVKAVRNKCKNDINRFRNELIATTPEQYKQDLEIFHPVLCNINKIICRFFTIQEEIKKERNCLSFADVAGSTLRLLVKDYNLKSGEKQITPLANEISEGYDFVMLDEYQDTNLLQNLIFESVSDNGKKLFCVGDVKQSIYRFRRAMPELFLNKLGSAKKAGEGFPALVTLSKNFRSSEGVISFVNFFFSLMMSNEATEIEYNEMHSLNLGSSYPEGDYNTKVTLVLSDKEESADIAGEEDRKAYAQGKACAMEIKRLLKEGRQVYDAKTKTKRPLRLSDIVILMRSVKNRAKGYMTALLDEGIDAYSDTAASFFENYEVLFFIAFLEAVDNPYNDMALAAALRSPMYAFSVQELTDIRESKDKVTLYECLCEYNSQKAKRAVESLSSYRSLAANLPVYRLIWQAFTDFSLFEIVGGLGMAEKRIENLKRIYMSAKDYENSTLKGLYGFLRFLEKLREQWSDSENSQAAPNGDYVKITTIHKSKGMEYPIVFLCGTDVAFQTADVRSRLIPHDQLGIGCTLRDHSDNTEYATLQREAIKTALKKEINSEEMRLLYVAMTRAKEKLYIILYKEGNFSKYITSLASEVISKEKAPRSFIDGCRCAGDWIMYALLNHKCFNGIKKEFSISVPSVESSSNVDVEAISMDELINTSKSYAKIKQESKNIDNIKEVLNFTYPYAELCDIPAKVSVSDLKGIRPIDEDGKPMFKEEFSLKAPSLASSQLSPAQKGTAFHRFMQFINLNNYNIEEQAKQLRQQGVLSDAELKSLPYEKLEGFLRSSLAEKMRRSKNICREYRFLSDINAGVYGEISDELKDTTLLIQGVIDMFFEDENGNIVLVDYKTDKAENEEYFVQRYTQQLKLYAQALEKILKKNIQKRIIYSVSLEKEIEV